MIVLFVDVQSIAVTQSFLPGLSQFTADLLKAELFFFSLFNPFLIFLRPLSGMSLVRKFNQLEMSGSPGRISSAGFNQGTVKEEESLFQFLYESVFPFPASRPNSRCP